MKIFPIKINKEIDTGDNLTELIVSHFEIKENDVLVIAQKIISKNEGQTINLSTITPSLLAQGISSQYNKNPAVVELILAQSKKIIRMEKGVLIVETNHGFICANAGIDESNVENGFATLLPINSDESASKIRKEIKQKTGNDVAVLISDTFGRPFREGQTNHAIGVSGIEPILDYSGTEDSFGKVLRVTAIAIADELCGAAELVMEKTKQSPIVIIRDYNFKNRNLGIDTLLREGEKDLFR